MGEMAEIEIPKGYREDQQGRLVPDKLISKLDKERDELVRLLGEEGMKLSAELAAYKARTIAAAQKFIARSAAEYDTQLGGQKGNVTMSTYDGRLRITLTTHDRIQFDERLQVAKQLIDKCLRRWTKNANANVRALTQEAFKADRRGRLDTGRLLSLRKLKIEDAEWQKAMSALSDAITVTRSQQYLRLQRRREDGGYDPIHLSIAAV